MSAPTDNPPTPPASTPQLAYEHNGRLVAREPFYAVACDPRRSVSVEACAGAGKTWMLVSRIVRALLDGCPPHEILAITFTRKAAGEMRERLHDWAAKFAADTHDDLAKELATRGVAPTDAHIAALRAVQSLLLAAPRPVQIRTFHSWFAALVRSAPAQLLLDMGLPLEYELLEQDDEAVARVWPRFYAAVLRDPACEKDFHALAAEYGRSQTHKALGSALTRRVEFALADAQGAVDASAPPSAAMFPEFGAYASPWESLTTAAAQTRWFARSASLGGETKKTPQTAAAAVIDAFAAPPGPGRLAALRKAFFVAAEDRLTHHLTKFKAAQEAEIELQTLCAAQAQHDAWMHQQRMARLTRVLLREFAAVKRENRWIDMGDVERAAHRLLSDEALSGWVQQRLDARVRQLLIDEFQDTNPLQWQALHAWLSSYAGAGGGVAGEAGGPPSVFIVGDPKQSIYRFRRAEPQVFRAAQAFVVDALGGDRLSCDHTRRNAPPIIAAVNAVMLDAQTAGEYSDFRLHTTESEAAGAVLRLPPFARGAAESVEDEDGPGASAWRDSLTEPRLLLEETARTLECRQAARWIARQLGPGADAGAALRPQDVMVLSRKRAQLSVLQDELRNLGVATEQPEKTNLGDAPEVQDVVALLDALVSPGHDLSLARALRSPIFGCTDGDLSRIAVAQRAVESESGVRPSWFDLLSNKELSIIDAPALGPDLLQYRQWVKILPPHDALDAIYHHADVIARFAAAAPVAMRASVIARLQALLAAALAMDGGRYLTPYAFVRALRSRHIPAPSASHDGAAVRLLTVHGAKGLEASLVLLLDTDGPPPKSENMGALIEWPGEAPAPTRYLFLASESKPPPCAFDWLDTENAARRREELNGLYVAMTRAVHRLVLSSTTPAKRGAAPSWWSRLEPLTTLVDASALDADTDANASPLDPWAPFALNAMPNMRPAHTGYGDKALSFVAIEAQIHAQLRPLAAEPALPPGGDTYARIGQAMHRLLEWSPLVQHDLASEALAEFWADASDPARVAVEHEFLLDPSEVDQAVALARRVRGGHGAWAWRSDLLAWHGAEVALAHGGAQLRIDRLVRRRDTGVWWVLDYKSAWRPETQDALLTQLRTYRAAVQLAYPMDVVCAAFLTGEGALVEIT